MGTGGDWFEVDLTERGYALDPGEFILAHTAETITIPDDCSAMVLLRSSAARAGYEHSLAGWCDPGFSGQITLELRNNLRFRHLPVSAGLRLCQLVVHKLRQHQNSSTPCAAATRARPVPPPATTTSRRWRPDGRFNHSCPHRGSPQKARPSPSR